MQAATGDLRANACQPTGYPVPLCPPWLISGGALHWSPRAAARHATDLLA